MCVFIVSSAMLCEHHRTVLPMIHLLKWRRSERTREMREKHYHGGSIFGWAAVSNILTYKPTLKTEQLTYMHIANSLITYCIQVLYVNSNQQ